MASVRSPRLSFVAALTMPLVCALAACSQAINPSAVADAQTAVRVKTALVNDATVGPRPIEVRVTRGVVTLTGQVASDAEVARAVEITRSVSGVVQVVADLTVRPGLDAEPARNFPDRPAARAGEGIEDPRIEFAGAGRDRSILAVGLSVGVSNPSQEGGTAVYSVAPLVRLGRGSGLGLSIGLGWLGTDVAAIGLQGSPGQLRLRPIMAGPGYTLGEGAIRTSLSLVGGVAINSLSGTDRAQGPVWALSVTNSFAWRPGVSVWIDLSPRTAVNTSVGYLVTRPSVSLLENGQVRSQTVRADNTVVRAGIVYKIF